MKCPFCNRNDTYVKDSRHLDEGCAVRRRRFCSNCKSRFTTFERVYINDLYVVKRNGHLQQFDRNKIYGSIFLAIRKRPITREQIDNMVFSVERQLQQHLDNEITTTMIGEMVMEALANADHVSYIRYASVYKEFNEIKDFDNIVRDLSKT